MSLPTSPSSDPLADASKALRHSDEVDAAKAAKKAKAIRIPKLLDKSIEQAQAVGSYLPDASSPGAATALQMVQSEIDKMSRRSDILLGALTDLQQIHPFVSIAVLALKTAIKLEVTRRDNDKRVLTVRIAMNDLFSVILLIKDLPSDSGGTPVSTSYLEEKAQEELSIKSRLEARLKHIANDIKECSGVCDTFQNKRTIVKLFMSSDWEKRFEDYLALFKQHGENIHEDLSLVIGTGIKKVQLTLDKISENTSMTLLMQLLRSPRERELQRFIDSKGGPTEVLKNDSLMQELIRQSGEAEIVPSKGLTELFQEIQREVKKTVADSIEENFELFSGKFEAQQEQLKYSLELAMQRQSDRIIYEIGEGPHKRITDPDLRQIWKDMGWMTTVKARQMVMALREHYAEHRRNLHFKDRALIENISSAVNSPASSSPKQILFEVTQIMSELQEPDELKYAQDDWALEYITITRIQPLLEAFDDDSSSLVSIAEVNIFTEAKPRDWSLLKWMAYWTAGFPLTLKRYYNLVQILIGEIESKVAHSLQVNKQIIKNLVLDRSISGNIDRLLAGVYEAANDIYEDDELHDRFREFVVSEESRMQKILHILKYRIDAENTLRMVTGPGRLEKYIMPLLYLLFVRVYQVATLAMSKVIDTKEVFNLLGSFEVINFAIGSRVRDLKAVCKLQNLDPREQLRRVSYGIFYYTEFMEDSVKSRYWREIRINGPVYTFEDVGGAVPLFQISDPSYADLNTISAIAPGDLFYPGAGDSLDFGAYDEITESSASSDITPVKHNWHGVSSWIYPGAVYIKSPAGLLSFHLPEGNGVISGNGSDSVGEFSLTGQVDHQVIRFNKCFVSGTKRMWRYDGKLNRKRDTITGKWGPCNDVLQNNFHEKLQESEVTGDFKLTNTFQAIRKYVKMNDDDSVAPETLVRDRWQLAIKAVIVMLRLKRGIVDTTYLMNRRKIRHRLLKLWSRHVGSEAPSSTWQINAYLSDQETEELSAMISYCSMQDVRFYRSLTAALRRRVVVHWRNVCDKQDDLKTLTHYNLITGTRFVCLNCLKTDPITGELLETVDLCHEHMNAEVDRTYHRVSHDLIQFRFCCSSRAQSPLLKAASEIARHLQKEDSNDPFPRKYCHVCHSAVARPYWYCLSCSGVNETYRIQTFICMNCKDKLDSEYNEVLDIHFENPSNTPPMGDSEQANEGGAELDVDDSAKLGKAADEMDPMSEGAGFNDGDAASEAELDAAEVTTKNSDAAAAESSDEELESVENPAEMEINQSANADHDGGSAEENIEEEVTHVYHHTMILCRALDGQTSPVSKPLRSIEERITDLSDRLTSFIEANKSMEARIVEQIASMLSKVPGSAAPLLPDTPRLVLAEEVAENGKGESSLGVGFGVESTSVEQSNWKPSLG